MCWERKVSIIHKHTDILVHSVKHTTKVHILESIYLYHVYILFYLKSDLDLRYLCF
jgi:hypothetical protein